MWSTVLNWKILKWSQLISDHVNIILQQLPPLKAKRLRKCWKMELYKNQIRPGLFRSKWLRRKTELIGFVLTTYRSIVKPSLMHNPCKISRKFLKQLAINNISLHLILRLVIDKSRWMKNQKNIRHFLHKMDIMNLNSCRLDSVTLLRHFNV